MPGQWTVDRLAWDAPEVFVDTWIAHSGPQRLPWGAQTQFRTARSLGW